MSATTITDGTHLLAPHEQRVVESLRRLPPEAHPRVEAFLSLLDTRAANPGTPDAETPAKVANALRSEAFQRVIRSVPPAEAELILEFAAFIAGRSLSWSYADPASAKLAADLMGLDPFLQREVREINREFEGTLADGMAQIDQALAWTFGQSTLAPQQP